MSEYTFISRNEFRLYYGCYRRYLGSNKFETKVPDMLTEGPRGVLDRILDSLWSTDPLDSRFLLNQQESRLYRLKQMKAEGHINSILNISTKIDVSRLI